MSKSDFGRYALAPPHYVLLIRNPQSNHSFAELYPFSFELFSVSRAPLPLQL